MNYNVRLFNLYEWIPKKGVETQILDFIKTEAPDILSVQEYHPHKNIDLSFFKYKFEKLSGSKTKYGQAIFSKFPIINSGSIEFPDTANNAIYADVVKGKDTLRIYNIHLESMRIETKVEDLKTEDSERLFKRISSTFKMQQFQTELFLTYDFKFFPIRIDFIFADEAFNVNGFKAYNNHYSDHYPIMTTLSLTE